MQLPRRTINADTKIVVKRMLPVTGETLVSRGERVEALDVVARAALPNRYLVIDVARHLAQPNVDMSQVMRKTEGEAVQANEVIASNTGGLPFLRRSVRAPAAGYLASIGPGWVLLATASATVELQAFVNGNVSWVSPDQGVVIETMGTLVEAACGFGGEAFGVLKRLTDSPFEPLQAAAIDASASDSIILGGSWLDEDALRYAEEMRVRGIIIGSVDAALLNLDPPVKVRVVATEGFGRLAMAPHTFGVLRALTGREVAIRGCTPALSPPGQGLREDPPVIIGITNRVPPPSTTAEEPNRDEVKVGSRVRITRGRWQSYIGAIALIPAKPDRLESGLIVPGAYVKLDDGRFFIPWANLEQIV